MSTRERVVRYEGPCPRLGCLETGPHEHRLAVPIDDEEQDNDDEPTTGHDDGGGGSPEAPADGAT